MSYGYEESAYRDEPKLEVRNPDLVTGDHRALTKRKIKVSTCRKYDYRVGTVKGKPVQLATYYNDKGQAVAQKVRTPDKKFYWLGDPSEAGLFGQQLFNGGKKVVVTEGEIDALSVSQAQDNRWPVVSVPGGAGGAALALAKELEWLEGFEEIVLMFDSDEPGREAAHACAELFTPGKAKVASLPRKDANECLQHGEVGVIVSAMWDAVEVRPDGIVAGTELWDLVREGPEDSDLLYPWPFLNDSLYGHRHSEIVTWCAGSGVGKSAVCREIFHHLISQGVKVGIVALEESLQRTALGMMGLHLDKPLHLPNVMDEVPEEQFKEAYEKTVGSGQVYLYDHWGSVDADHLANKIRAMVRHYKVDAILLDHVSIMVSGEAEGDERRLLDNTMTKLRTLAQELGVIFHLVSHLRRPQGTAHEEGGITSLAQLRGSAAIAQLSDAVVGLERNQQDAESSDVTCVRVLKNRFAGITGIAGYLQYDKETGRLTNADCPFSEEEGEGGEF